MLIVAIVEAVGVDSRLPGGHGGDHPRLSSGRPRGVVEGAVAEAKRGPGPLGVGRVG